MNREELQHERLPVLANSQPLAGRRPGLPLFLERSLPPSQHGSSLSSSPTEHDWVSPFTLPPLPSLRRHRGHSEQLKSPEHLRQREGSGAYYAAAWGSPYATPSPRRSPKPLGAVGGHRADRGSEVTRRPTAAGSLGGIGPGVADKLLAAKARQHTGEERRNPRSERPNWLSDSEESGSEASTREIEQTPTRASHIDSWGPSPVGSLGRVAARHRISESLATITPDTFDGAAAQHLAQRQLHPTSSPTPKHVMAEENTVSADSAAKPLPNLPRRVSVDEPAAATKPSDPQQSPTRPRQLSSVPSFQRPKKKVVWKGKACIIALPLTDRETAGLPPLLSAQEVKRRLDDWVSAGYNVDGFDITRANFEPAAAESGQSRSVFPDPTDLQVERKGRHFPVSIPDQGEWEAWVNYIKEEKLRALGVSPSNSEAPPSSRSPFSPPLSRVSSGYPNLAGSPPVASSSSASNPIRATGNPFSPSVMSSAGISPQPGSTGSPYNGMPKPMHAYKQSMVIQSYGRATSPYDNPLNQQNPYPPGARPNPLASRQNSFSPLNHAPIRLPNVGEVLSPVSQFQGQGANGRMANVQHPLSHVHANHRHMPSQAQAVFPQSNQHTPSPAMPPRGDSLVRTPEYSEATRTPIEIAHPTPKSHRHNLSMALQKEIDDAEAAAEKQKEAEAAEEERALPEPPLRTGSVADESNTDEPPILRRPETINTADEKSEIETNPSLAATPMLMGDENPFKNVNLNMNWQVLSDAARADSRPAQVPAPIDAPSKPSQPEEPSESAQPSPMKFNVEAKEFNPKFNVAAKEFNPSEAFGNSTFSFNANPPKPVEPPRKPPFSAPQRPTGVNRLSISNLNASAPAFTPSFGFNATPKEPAYTFGSSTFNIDAPEFKSANSTPQKSTFTFSSSAFNVDAPEFKSSIGSTDGNPTESVSSIFGKVVIAPNSTVTRRTSKALPIVAPESSFDESSESESELEIEEDGRPMAPIDRQKRARTVDSDGDQPPVYADSAPFQHTRILSEIVDEADVVGIEPEKPSEKPVDGWSYIPADESVPAEEPEPTKVTDQGHTPSASESDYKFQNQSEAAKFNDARPPHAFSQGDLSDDSDQEAGDLIKREDSTPVPFKKEEVNAIQPSLIPEKSTSRFKSSLSALAKPFEFKSAVASPPVPSSLASTPRKPQGLEASKWGQPTKSSESTAELTANLSSPPADLYAYADPADDSVRGDNIDEDEDYKVSPLTSEDEQGTAKGKGQEAKEDSVEPLAQQFSQELEVPTMPLRHSDDQEPSFEEIDAVMRQFEVHPELGVERTDTPILSTPLVDMSLGNNFRSDAPSPSPERSQLLISGRSEASYGLGIGVHNLNRGKDEVSDWGDEIPAAEEAKLQLRAQFFDGHVNDLVGGILESRLGPLENALKTIQDSLALMATHSRPKQESSRPPTDVKDSDADDEEDYDAFEGFSHYRSRSPVAKRERKDSRVRAIVEEALAAYQPPVQAQPTIDMTALDAMVEEMRELAQKSQSKPEPDLKGIMEDVIANHPRLRGQRAQQDHGVSESKLKPQIDGLEAMLKVAKENASEESKLRREAEEEIASLRHRLRLAEEEAAQHRESSEEAQNSLRAFVEEKSAYQDLEQDVEELTLKNAALEKTLEEYRASSDQWREDIHEERLKNKEMRSTLQELRHQLEEQLRSRESLRAKVERVQERMTCVVQDLHSEQADWREKEHHLRGKLALAEDLAAQERRHREKAVLDLESLEKEHKANMSFKPMLEQANVDIAKLNETVSTLRDENRVLDTKAFSIDRELQHALNSKDAELATATARLQAELESATSQLESLKSDSQAQILRLQNRLDHAEIDIEDHKAKHADQMAETLEGHKDALREAAEKREASLEEQHQAHEKKLGDLRDRHTRELHNSFDNRSRLEHQLNEKLALSDDKIKHLESKLVDLTERLDITKAAAKAAVEAATAKGVNNLPTPAPSVVASPPHRATSASLSFAKGSEVPEKISPQALRESIMVLQDQLQNREQKIEQLEAELAAVDKDAPNKLRDKETENSWLRELLGVRLDDLEDIIGTVSQPDFDREAVKDAAIRLKANLQMEQQLKERAASISGISLPSMATLSSYAQSPRALPMAAAAAWGNWRRARDTSIGALSDIANTLGNQTPSKSTMRSPSASRSGMITPPATGQRSSTENTPIAPPSMRPLAAAAHARKAGAGEARPLRAYNSQPRALSSRQQDKRPEIVTLPESPQTPISSNRTSLDLADDVDDDASPLDGKATQQLEEADTDPLES